MFEQNTPRTTMASAAQHANLIYHSIVRDVRKSHNNAFMSIFVNIFQTATFVLVFYVMFSVLGLRALSVGAVLVTFWRARTDRAFTVAMMVTLAMSLPELGWAADALR